MTTETYMAALEALRVATQVVTTAAETAGRAGLAAEAALKAVLRSQAGPGGETVQRRHKGGRS